MGLVAGGLLTELGWRWVFLLPVPIALGLLVAAPRYLPRDRIATATRRSFDIPGAVTLTAAMLLLVRTVVEAPQEGWGSPVTIGSFAVTAALLAAFLTIEQRSASPLVRLGILRSGPLVRANLGMMTLFGAYVGFQFVMTLYLQTMNGWSPVETALAFLPAGILVAVGSPRIGPIVDRLGAPRVIALGTAATAIGYALVLRFDAHAEYLTVLLPTMLLIGIGFMLLFPALNIQATMGVANHEQGLASGLVQTSFQIGGAVGLAIVSAVVSSGSAAGDLFGAYQTAVGVALAIAALGLLVAIVGLLREPRAEAKAAFAEAE
jgi:predicted MFS family arabinose efflux permease